MLTAHILTTRAEDHAGQKARVFPLLRERLNETRFCEEADHFLMSRGHPGPVKIIPAYVIPLGQLQLISEHCRLDLFKRPVTKIRSLLYRLLIEHGEVETVGKFVGD